MANAKRDANRQPAIQGVSSIDGLTPTDIWVDPTNGALFTEVASNTGRTLISTGGTAASSGNNTLVAAGTNHLKIYAFSLSTLSTTPLTCIFQSGASGIELWRVLLQAGTSTSTGANLAVTPPGYLFATAAATLLNLSLSSAQTVHWSVSYFDEP